MQVIDLENERLFQDYCLSAEKANESNLLLFKKRMGIWMRNSRMICQMCFADLDESMKPTALCPECEESQVSPVESFVSGLPLSVQFKGRPSKRVTVTCGECQLLTRRYERINLCCCQNWICLECYVDNLEEPSALCPYCDSDLPVYLWAVHYYYITHALKPGMLQFFNVYSRSHVEDLVKNEPTIAIAHAQFTWQHWLLEKFEKFENVQKRNGLDLYIPPIIDRFVNQALT